MRGQRGSAAVRENAAFPAQISDYCVVYVVATPDMALIVKPWLPDSANSNCEVRACLLSTNVNFMSSPTQQRSLPETLLVHYNI